LISLAQAEEEPSQTVTGIPVENVFPVFSLGIGDTATADQVRPRRNHMNPVPLSLSLVINQEEATLALSGDLDMASRSPPRHRE